MPIPTNECVMCGISIPEGDVSCKECAGYCVACIAPPDARTTRSICCICGISLNDDLNICDRCWDDAIYEHEEATK